MRYLSLSGIFCLLAGLCFLACNKNDEQPQLAYPLSFTLTRAEFNPASFYEIGANSYSEVQPGGLLTLFETILQEDLQEEVDAYFEVRSLELLNDTLARAEVYNFSDNSTQFVEVGYEDNGSEVVFGDGGGQLVFERNAAFDELRFCIFTYVGAYYDEFFQRRDLTGTVGATCWEAPLEAKLDSIRNDLSLEIGDTIGTSTSYFIFE